jgi:hypothetical protein
MLMWFVNIDHWTLKLAYLAFEKVTDNQTENINQVDISIFFFKVKKRGSISLYHPFYGSVDSHHHFNL